MGAQLPALTKAVITASRFVQHRWYLIIGIVLAVVLSFRSFAKTPRGARTFSRLALKLPGVKKLTVKSACANMLTLDASRYALTNETLVTKYTPMPLSEVDGNTATGSCTSIRISSGASTGCVTLVPSTGSHSAGG